MYDEIRGYETRLIAIYPIMIQITDEKNGIDRTFCLDDLKDIKTGVIKLTDYEKERLFVALLGFCLERAESNYESAIEDADKKGISRDRIKTRV